MTLETRPELLPEGWGMRRRTGAVEAAPGERLVPVLTEVLELDALPAAHAALEARPDWPDAEAAVTAADALLPALHGDDGLGAEHLESLAAEVDESLPPPEKRIDLEALMTGYRRDGSESELVIDEPLQDSARFAEHLDDLLSELVPAGSSPLPASPQADTSPDMLQPGANVERGDQFLAALDGLHDELLSVAPDASLIELQSEAAADIELAGAADATPADLHATPDLAVQTPAVAGAIDETLLDHLLAQALVPALEETLVRLAPLIADELRASLRGQFAALLAQQSGRPQG